MKHIRMLTAFAFFFSFTSAFAQELTCSLSDSQSGDDSDEITATVDDFSCIDTVADSYVTSMTIDASIGFYCDSWYDYSLEINGVAVDSGLCEESINIADYVEDLNTVTSISLVSNDLDGWSDGVTVELDVYINYLITDCPPPNELEISSITSSSALFEWNSNGSELLWDIELVDITAGDTATGVPTTYGAISESFSVTSLTPDNMYEIYVRANCITGSSVESVWVGPIAFTTDPTCYPVTDLEVIDLIDISATAIWSSSETEWEIELIDVTAGDAFVGIPTVLSLTDTSYDFTGLTPDNTYSFKVRSNCGAVDGNSTWSSTITFTTDPSCLAPVDLEITSFTNSTVTLNWVSSDDESQWGIEIINVDNGDAQDFVPDYTSTDTTYTIPGLSGTTTYQVYVSAICSSTDSSEWVSFGQFTTLCDVYTPEYTENFDTFLDPCWAESEGPVTGPDLSDVTSLWFDDEFLNISGGSNSAKINLYTTNRDEWLITPIFDLSLGGYELNFNVGVTGYLSSNSSDMGSDDSVRVMQSLDGGATWTTLHTWTVANQPTNAGDAFSIDISTLTGSNVQFAFYATDGPVDDSEDYDFFIDNFKVRTIPTCFEVGNLTAENVLANSADLSWSAGELETSWQIEYALTGFTQGTGTYVLVNDSSYSLTALTAESEYDVYVRSVCSVGDSSGWTGPISFTTLCDASIPDYHEDFATYLNPCWTESEGPITGPDYNDVTSIWTDDDFVNTSSSSAKVNLYTTGNEAWLVSPLFDLSAGGYEINLDAGVTSWNSTNTSNMGSDDTVRVMQSLDGGTTWTEIYSWHTSNTPSNTGDNISIEVGSVTGSAVRFAIFASDGSTNDPEDYDFFIDNFKVRTIPTCPVFTDLAVTNVLSYTADIGWDPFGLEVSWEIQYGTIGFTPGSGTSIITTDSNYTLNGLTAETPYHIYVRGICGAADSSFWVGPIGFTTLVEHDIAVSEFNSPLSQGCMLTTAEEVVITISNNGGLDATGFDVSYSFDGINYTSDGLFTGVLAADTDTAYTLNTTFDFSTADDTNLFVAVDLITDTTYVNNDSNSYFISNLGDQLLNLEVVAGQYAGEHIWYIIDTLSGNTIADHTSSSPVGGEYSDYQTYNHDVCVFLGNTYSFEAWDSFGDGWNGGVYELTQCGGVVIADNGGLSPTTLPNSGGVSLESQEYFTVEECDDYDLGIIMMDSIYSTCDMTATEQGYLLVQNYGLMDITSSMNVSIEYQINGSGWANLATISDLASGADSLLALPTVDMTTPLTYTFEFQIIYALDENSSNDTLDVDVESVDTYMEANQDFDDAPSGWTAHIATGTTSSWEWGVPTTTLISNNVDGSAWVTRLDEDMFLNEESYLLSPCFDFTAYTSEVEFNFDFIWTSPATSNSVRFQVSTDGGATWPTFTGSDNILMPINTTEWTNYIGLLDIAGEGDVKFRFFMDNGFSTDAEGFGMDNFEIFEHALYADTTLALLTVDGDTIPGFDPALFNYTYEVPFGTTTVPNVDAVVNAPFYESLEITQATGIPGVATVIVTAEDTNFTATYTVTFVEAPASTNAYLSDLQLDGVTITGFDSLVFTYTETVPFGGNQSVVTSETSDATANSVQTSTGAVPGSVTIVVTAQDGVTTNTYIVNFDEEPADTVSTLSSLFVDGDPVVGFDPETLNYTVEVNGTATTIDYTTTSTFASTSTLPAGPSYAVPSTVVITVTAQDGSTTDYTINLVEPLSDNAYLTDLSYETGGTYVTVPGFDSLTFSYTIELPFGSVLPNTDYVTSDADAVGSTTTSGTVIPGTTTVEVTAVDGSTLTYTINWTEAAPNSNNLLASVSFENTQGQSVGVLSIAPSWNPVTLDPLVNVYVYYVTNIIDAATIPTILPVKQDPTADIINIVTPNAWGDPYKVDVQAEDGTINTYIFNTVNAVGQEELEAGSVSIFPNPSTGVVNVEVKEDIKDYTIEVVSTTGQKVFVGEYNNDNTQVSLDLSTVAEGLYYVILRDTQSGKFTKEKISIIK